MKTDGDRIRRLAWTLGAVWAVGISLYLLSTPAVSEVSVSVSLRPGGPVETGAPVYASSSRLKTQGLSAAGPMAVPVLLTLVPLFVREPKKKRVAGAVCAGVLGTVCALGLFSYGPFYLPSVGTLLLAVVLSAIAD